MGGFWSNWFRFGLYDHLMPTNYDRSMKEAFELLAPKEDARIADFGCGNGRLLLHAGEWLRKGGALEGFDIDESGLEKCKLRAKEFGLSDRANFQMGNLCQLNELNLKPFDGAIAHFSLYTLGKVDDRKKALSEMFNLIKPGGKIIVSVPSESYRIASIVDGAKKMEDERTDIPWYWKQTRKNLHYRILRKAMMPIEKAIDSGHFHKFAKEELASKLKSAGFEVEQIISSYSGNGYHAVARVATT